MFYCLFFAIVVLATVCLASPTGAVDPWDKATDEYPGAAIWLWFPLFSNDPTIIFYSVKNTATQRMNYRVECTLNNLRLGRQDIYSAGLIMSCRGTHVEELAHHPGARM
jgi:hypothetical protein